MKKTRENTCWGGAYGLMTLILGVVMLAGRAPGAPAPQRFRAAVVTSKTAVGEFDRALEKAGWKSDTYADTPEEWKQVAKKLGSYDLILACPGMRGAAEIPDASQALLGFMEAGGAVVVTGVESTNDVMWLSALGPKGEVGVKTPEASKEGVSDQISPDGNATALIYPERAMPAGAVMAHFAFAGQNGREWEVAGRRKDNQPCVIVRRLGKGALVLSTARFQDAAFLGNLAKLLELQRMGLAYVGVKHDYGNEGDLALGRGTTRLTLRNTSGTNMAAKAVMVVTGGETSRTFWGCGTQKTAGQNVIVEIPVMMDLRGTCKVAVSVIRQETGEEAPLLGFSADLPPFLEVLPPTYRGMISTARRESDVRFALRLNPVAEEVRGLTIEVSLSAPDGRVLVSREVVAADAGRLPLSLPLAADAPVGIYTLAAKTVRGGALPESASATFKIVPVRPGQLFVDQDGVLLEEGAPFFPIGLYHVAAPEFEAAAKTGVNMIQLWNWDANPTNLARIRQAGVRVLYEDQFWGEVVWNHAKRLPFYNFETNLATLARVKTVRDDPSRAVAMWYTADEPSFGMMPHVSRIRDYWYALDEDRPTYIVSTGDPRLEAGADVFGVDVYPVYYGHHRPLTLVGDVMDTARQGVRYAKPVIAVIQSFGDNERHHEKPGEVRCMTYLALTHGVRGVFWYCWKETGDQTGFEGAGHHPETVRALTEMSAEIKVLSPALLASGNRTLKSDDGRVHAILCGNGTTGRFLVYVNGEYEPTESVLALPELVGAKLEALFGGPAAKVRDGRLALKLPGLATGAFRVTDK